MNKNTKLSKEAKILIIDLAIRNVITIFLNIFLTAYFYKISSDNLMHLSAYYLVTYIVTSIVAFFISVYIKKYSKMHLYRLGLFIMLIYILYIIFIKEEIINHTVFIGVFNGLAVALVGFTFNMILSEQVSNKERTRFVGYKSAILEVIGVVIPILIGGYITVKSYESAAIIIFIICFIEFIITFFINDKFVQEKSKLHIKDFFSIVKEDKIIKKIYIIEFFKGITVYGGLKLIVSLLIIYQLKTDFELGILTSVFSGLTIIAMFLFGKFYNKEKPKLVLILCSVTSVISLILLCFSINIVTVIIYNIVFYTFIGILLNITEVKLFDYSNKEPFDNKYNTEYFLVREMYLNVGRSIGYIMTLIVGITQNMELLKIILVIDTISLVIISVMSNKLKSADLRGSY